jgi:UDP-N-acetylmuramate--alanine ligase
MHIYFLGIGGTGIGPLAIIAKQAGYEVSGSDQGESEYTKNLTKIGISISIGDPSRDELHDAHTDHPIDWIVTVSAILRQNPDHPVFVYARENGIRLTERDECLNQILNDKKLRMLAAAGTHGKTTTTAMFVWVLKQLGIPISYSVGAKMSFADMGHYEPGSEYFVYECDEFHRNFLNFYPHLSVISGIAWDHHEVFPTQKEYDQAFLDFINQTKTTILWQSDATRIQVPVGDNTIIVEDTDPSIDALKLHGHYNRKDARLVIEAVQRLFGTPTVELQKIMEAFPGTSRRMEELKDNLFSDYAHTPEKIVGCLSVAVEIAAERNKKLVVVYEPLTNRRQHFMKELYKEVFRGVSKLYWVPSYLAREDPTQVVLGPEDLIKYLEDPTIASPANLDGTLWEDIENELAKGALVVCMSGGGSKSLDEWLRKQL